MNASPLENPTLAAFSKNWSQFLIWGIVLVILGLIAISTTVMTTLISVIFLSFLLLISGIVIMVDACTFWWKKGNGFFLHLLFGILYFAIGIMLLEKPILTAVSLTLLLGIFYLVLGLFRTIDCLTTRTPRWGWNLFNAIISLLLGILILCNWPLSGLYIIGLFVGIDLLFTGLSYVMGSLAARSLINK